MVFQESRERAADCDARRVECVTEFSVFSSPPLLIPRTRCWLLPRIFARGARFISKANVQSSGLRNAQVTNSILGCPTITTQKLTGRGEEDSL